jgi:penicillin-binding protein 2
VISLLLLPGSGFRRRDRPIRTGRRDKPIIKLPSIALRVAVMVGIAVVLFSIILFRLWFLQILSGQQFVAQANDNRLRSVKILAPRGTITDRKGKVIVQNRPGLAVGMRTMDVPAGQLPTIVRNLAAVLKMPARDVRHQVNKRKLIGLPYDLVIIKEDVKTNVVSYLLEHDQSFPGVEIQQNYLRDYPQGNLAAQILGNVGGISAAELKQHHFKGYAAGDVVGQAGLEWSYDRWLRGRDGVAKVEVDSMGRPKANAPVPGGRLPQPGDTLVTTIDAKVQAAAEKALVKGIEIAHSSGDYAANGGAAVVMDVHSGQVLAMASNPTFNPKVYVGGLSTKDYKKLSAKSANYPLLDRPIQEAIAVGSTFKPITATAALEEGVITPSTSFYCSGSYIIPNTSDKQVFHCWLTSGHGSLSLIPAITQSCDVYFYNVGDKFYVRPGNALQDWAERLGLGKPTSIDIPAEVAGRIPTRAWKRQYFKTAIGKIWEPGDAVQLAVGQGYMEATPLQLATAYAAIANGGTIVQPHLGLKIVDSQGQLVSNLEATTSSHKVDIALSTLDAVRTGLRDAASTPLGTSSPVFSSYPIAVAGKTGTAQVYDASVQNNVNYAWYASYAPFNDPKYVVVVMIEKGGHGGTAAAPAARIIYDQLFGVKGGVVTGSARSD